VLLSEVQQRPGDPAPAVIEACRRGNREALDSVLRANAPAIERLLARMIGPGADLEDLLQTTLIAVVEAFPRYRGEASVRTWMTRIAVNVVRQHLRRPYRGRRVSLELVPAEPADASPTADDVADQREMLARMFGHLDAIGPKKRLAFVLHVFEGHPIDEVAALTGASKSATKSRVFWARRALLARARKDPVLRTLLSDEGDAT
jgi:RNA polymerase sigma-70 factor (ECF subfamily)